MQGFRYWIRRPQSRVAAHGGAHLPPTAELRSLSSVLQAGAGAAGSQHAQRVVAGVQVGLTCPALPAFSAARGYGRCMLISKQARLRLSSSSGSSRVCLMLQSGETHLDPVHDARPS